MLYSSPPNICMLDSFPSSLSSLEGFQWSFHYAQIAWIPRMDDLHPAPRRCVTGWLQALSSIAPSAEMNKEFTYRRTYAWSRLCLGEGCNLFGWGKSVCDLQLCSLEVTRSGNSMYQRYQRYTRPSHRGWRQVTPIQIYFSFSVL